MRTYLILKDKAEQFAQDSEIQDLIAEINADSGEYDYVSSYSAENASKIKAVEFDRQALGARNLPYEKLDQLTIELLLGVR